jgi:catechol 2,3-dioxygenase-like lactoylglutathione lyase family enzyme
MAATFTELVVDAHDPHALAAFWSSVLGWSVIDGDEEEGELGDEVEIGPPDGRLPTLLFLRTPDDKAVKNRLHIDVRPTGVDQDTELARLLGLGAVEVDIGQGEQTWHVLADPEGNEFCLLRDPPS